MNSDRLTQRYAAHYLQLGSARLAWGCLCRNEEGRLCVVPFTEETPQTIFLSGTLRLYSDSTPLLPETSPTQWVSLQEFNERLSREHVWQLEHPLLP